jgi:hypothetical protein
LWIGEGLDQYAIDNAEDGRVRADAQRQRYQGDGGESRGEPESPEDLLKRPHGEYYVTRLSQDAKILAEISTG